MRGCPRVNRAPARAANARDAIAPPARRARRTRTLPPSLPRHHRNGHGPPRHIEHGEEHRGNAAACVPQGEEIRQLEAADHREVSGNGWRRRAWAGLIYLYGSRAGPYPQAEAARHPASATVDYMSPIAALSDQRKNAGQEQSRSAAEGRGRRPGHTPKGQLPVSCFFSAGLLQCLRSMWVNALMCRA